MYENGASIGAGRPYNHRHGDRGDLAYLGPFPDTPNDQSVASRRRGGASIE
jgi:hypothetical protein